MAITFPALTGRAGTVKNRFSMQKLMEAPCLMSVPQRLVLFSLTVATCPSRYIEIGPGRGGSAQIVRYAMHCNGDPDFKGFSIGPALKNVTQSVHHAVDDWFEFIEGICSIRTVMEAHRKSGASFDMVLIDALHDQENARFDAMTVFPYVSAGGIILFDDANYFEVQDAVDECVRMLPVEDCGLISRHGAADPKHKRPQNDRWQGEEAYWGGLHMLRKRLDAPTMDEKKSGPPLEKYVPLTRMY